VITVIPTLERRKFFGKAGSLDKTKSATHSRSAKQRAKKASVIKRKRFQKGSVYMNLTKTMWLGAFTLYELRNGVETRVRRQVTLAPIRKGDEKVSKRDAMRLLQPYLDTANAPTSEVKKTMTVSAFLDVWERDYLSLDKPSTQVVSRVYTRRMRTQWGERDMRSVRAGDVQSFITLLMQEHKLAPRSVRNIWKAISRVWNDALTQGYIDTALPRPKLPRIPKKKAKAFMLADVAQMIVKAPDDEWRVFLWLAAETGLRAGELAGVRLSDIDLEAGKLTVNVSVFQKREQAPKTDNALRILALSPQLVSLLRSQIKQQEGSRWLFTTNATPWDIDAKRRSTLTPLLKRLGIPQFGYHAFRHFNVALMDALRVPLRTIQERIGHAVTGSFTLDVYGGKFDYERNKEAAIALGAEIEKAVVSTSTTAKVTFGAALPLAS